MFTVHEVFHHVHRKLYSIPQHGDLLLYIILIKEFYLLIKCWIYLSSSEVRIKLTENKSRNQKTDVNFCFQKSVNFWFQVLTYMYVEIYLEQSFTCKQRTQSFWEWQKTPRIIRTEVITYFTSNRYQLDVLTNSNVLLKRSFHSSSWHRDFMFWHTPFNLQGTVGGPNEQGYDEVQEGSSIHQF